MTRAIRMARAGSAAAAAAPLIVGCGSSGPSAQHKREVPAAAKKRYQDGNAKAACVGLAAAAAAFDDAYGQGSLAGTLTNATNLISAVDKALTPGFGGTKFVGDDPVPGFLPPKMATDVPALTGLAGFPMETSSTDAGALQADCDSVGVTAPIWRQYPDHALVTGLRGSAARWTAGRCVPCGLRRIPG
jgi:hypothetical protein